MPGEAYQAGTIFLAVVPVFRDVQDKIRKQAKDINKVLGDDLEKGGQEAGDRAGQAIGDGIEKQVKASSKKATGELEKALRKTFTDVSKSLEPIDLRFENNDARQNIKQLKGDLKALGEELDKALTPKDVHRLSNEMATISSHAKSLNDSLSDVSKHDFAKTIASADQFEKKLESVRKAAAIEMRFDDRDAVRNLGAFESKVKRIAERAAKALGDPMDREIADLKRKLEEFGKLRIGIDVSTEEAKRKLKDLQLEAVRLSKQRVSIDVDAEDVGAAAVELLAFDTVVKRINGQKVRVSVDVDEGSALGKLAALKASLLGAGSGGDESANSFRSFNAVILAAVTLLPALIPILAAVGGGLLALGPLALGAGAGIATMVIGFSGISTAVQAFSQQQKKSAADSQTAAASIRAALYSVRDAQQAVGDAERSAARAAVDSARQVASARRSAADSIRSALESQRQAQESYRQSVQSVADAEQALADARDQQRKAQQSTRDQITDNRLSIRQALLNAFDATNNLNAVMADGSSTAYDKESAKLAYDQAQQQLKELREQRKQLAKDKKKQDKEGVNGSEAVQNAQEALTQAILAQRDAQRAVGEAARKVDEARIEGARAVQQALLQQSRSEEDGQRAVARAKEQLRRAQEGYNDALKKNNEIGSAADQNVRDALKNLGPAGREFARFISQLQQGFYDLRAKIQAAMLPPVQHAIETILTKYGPQFQRFFVRMARAAGGFFTDLSKAFDSKQFQRFGRVFDKLGPTFFRLFGRTTIEWLKIFASLMATAAPFSEDLARGLLGMSKSLSRFLESKKGREGVEHFMEYAQKIGPDVLDFLGRFVKFAVRLGIALAPWGGVVLKALDGLLNFLNGLSTKNLGLLATGIIGLFIAFQAGVGVTAAILGGMALLESAIGTLVAIVLVGIVVFAALYIRFKLVRQITAIWFKALKLYVKINYEFYKAVAKVVIAIAEWVAHFLHLKQVATTVFDWLKSHVPPIMRTIADDAIAVGKAIKSFWEDYAQPALSAFADIVRWVWQHAVHPILSLIFGAFRVLGRIIRAVWTGFIWPILDLMIHIFLRIGQKVWLPLIKGIISQFRNLGKNIRTVWRELIQPALSAFGDAADWLWKKILKPIFGLIGDRWQTLANNFKWVYDHTLKPVIDAFVDAMGGPQGLKSKFHAVVEAIGDMWAGLKRTLAAPVKFVLDGILNHGLIAGFNKIAKFVGSKPMDEIPLPKSLQFARGGVLPGYFPGGDNHHFVSPTGGRLDLSGGEAIMRPEFTRAVGGGFVNALNQAARSGGSGAVKKLLTNSAGHFFAKGGIFGQTGYANGGLLANPDRKVYMDGKAIAAIAAAQVLLAERLKQTNYYLMQGGFGGDHIAASGTSHNYPGVADISTTNGVTFADQAMLRKVGFAAWARNIPGAAYVGSGEHVHSASLLSPGTASSPQVSGSWPGHTDGLAGGPDYGPRPPLLANLGNLLGGFDLSKIDAGGGGKHGFGLPGWILGVAKNPLGYFADKITEPLHNLVGRFGDNGFTQMIAGVPTHLLAGLAHKAIDIIPGAGAIFKAAGNVINGVENFAGATTHAVGDALGHIGLRDGGILPYNGTMKYDAGGYLPPGLTSVVNLTGKPEPVFTHDQLDRMRGGQGGGFTYAPTYHDARGTEDILGDLEFAQRRFRRGTGRGPNSGGNQ